MKNGNRLRYEDLAEILLLHTISLQVSVIAFAPRLAFSYTGGNTVRVMSNMLWGA